MFITTRYAIAYERARQEANAIDRPVGIHCQLVYGRMEYVVRHVPSRRANRQGWETRCEIVEPNSAPFPGHASDMLAHVD